MGLLPFFNRWKGTRVETGGPVKRLLWNSGHRAVVALAAMKVRRGPQPLTHTVGVGEEFLWPSSKALTSRLGLAQGEARAQESHWRKWMCPIHRVLKCNGQSYHKTQGAMAGAPLSVP